MAYATIKGARYHIRVVKDLGENWSLELYPSPPKALKTFEPFKNWPVPLCMKICADTKGDALQSGLEHMKKIGQIDDYFLDPSERPAPAAVSAPKPPSPETDSEA